MALRTLKRRRLESKTDYLKRRKLLESEKPRIVLRKTNKYIILQLVESKQAKDKVRFGVNSKELLKEGWTGSLKSIPAAYLTGLMFGKKLGKEKIVIDTGLIRSTKGSKIYAALKGVIDAGVNLNVKEEMFPSEDRLSGKHMKEDFSKKFNEIKSKIEGAPLGVPQNSELGGKNNGV